MPTAQYLIRLDDACPTMNKAAWDRMEAILDKHSIRPIVAVIPANKSAQFEVEVRDDDAFWRRVKAWHAKGWTIGMHGFDHQDNRTNNKPTLFKTGSEFLGIEPELQKGKIRKSWEIFLQNGVLPTVWVAPWHTFDCNTLRALQDQTDIRIVSDGIAFRPYRSKGFLWIPVQLWGYIPFPRGIFTICLHPATMSDRQFEKLDSMLSKHGKKFITSAEIPETAATRNCADYLFLAVHSCVVFASKLRALIRAK